MSFSMTEQAFVDRRKDVTRRLGWKHAQVGQRIRAVDRCMGLKPGESPRELGVIRIVNVRRERLDAITVDDVKREGYPDMRRVDFITKFCRAMRCEPSTEVTRIEFEHIDE